MAPSMRNKHVFFQVSTLEKEAAEDALSVWSLSLCDFQWRFWLLEEGKMDGVLML